MPRPRRQVVYCDESELSNPEIVTSVSNSVAEAFEDPNHPARWKHRRRFAYMAMYSMLILTAYAMTPLMSVDRLERVSDIIEWFYFAMASIVGAYMGFATWSAKLGKQPPQS